MTAVTITITLDIDNNKVIFKKFLCISQQKKPLSFREFKKILPSAFIYESILIKINMIVNNMKT